MKLTKFNVLTIRAYWQCFKTLWKRFQQEGRLGNTLRVITEGIDKQRSMANSVRVTLFLLANVNGLAIVTLRTVEVDPPVYTMTSDTAYARCIRFLPSLFLAMSPSGGTFVSFVQIFCCLLGVKLW